MENLNIGSDIYIRLSTATAHCRIAVSSIFVTIVDRSEKAIKVQGTTENNKTVTFWLPIKSLVKISKANVANGTVTKAELATWFNPPENTWNKIQKITTNNIVSAQGDKMDYEYNLKYFQANIILMTNQRIDLKRGIPKVCPFLLDFFKNVCITLL